MTIKPGLESDAPQVAALYDALIDHLNATDTNYPRWIKGTYPTYETARNAAANGWLFVGLLHEEIVASCILNHHEDPLYEGGSWTIPAAGERLLVVHTLCVRPDQLRKGYAAQMLAHAEAYGKANGCAAVRLDTAVQNAPGIRMYESHGYTCVGEVDLKLRRFGLTLHRLYEKAL